MTHYILLERKDLCGNTLYALPREYDTPQVRNVLTAAGEIEVDPKVFGSTQRLRVVGSIGSHSHTRVNGVTEVFRELRKCGVDYEALVKDEKLMARILNYSVVFGDLYLMNFELTGKANPLNVPGLYLVDPNEQGEITREAPGEDLSALVGSSPVQVRKVGRVHCHFSSISPQTLDGKMGYGMDPRIMIQAKPFSEKNLKDFKTW